MPAVLCVLNLSSNVADLVHSRLTAIPSCSSRAARGGRPERGQRVLAGVSVIVYERAVRCRVTGQVDVESTTHPAWLGVARLGIPADSA